MLIDNHLALSITRHNHTKHECNGFYIWKNMDKSMEDNKKYSKVCTKNSTVTIQSSLDICKKILPHTLNVDITRQGKNQYHNTVD